MRRTSDKTDGWFNTLHIADTVLTVGGHGCKDLPRQVLCNPAGEPIAFDGMSSAKDWAGKMGYRDFSAEIFYVSNSWANNHGKIIHKGEV